MTFRFTIRRQQRPRGPWHVLADVATGLDRTARVADAEASEGDQLSLQVYPPPDGAPAVRVRVGSVLVASSLPADRVLPIDSDDASDADAPPLVCRGKLLADWVGLTELVVEVRAGDSAPWAKALLLPLAVSAGKLAAEQFHRLFLELERDSAAVLLDVCGKTQLGLKYVRAPAPAAPAAVLARLRETVRELNGLLHLMARQPASRLRSQWSREQALVGQAVSDSTLAEACRDPSMLTRYGRALFCREHLREHSRPDYRIAEHQVLSDFREYLKAQLADLRQRIDGEVADREARKRWRHVAREAGQPTWWEAEDLPRIDELQRCRRDVAQLRRTVDGWCRLAFLPPGRCLGHQPQSTPLFRNHTVYRRAFEVVAGHFLAYQATLDTHPLLMRARSLPVLYEWWCAVRVVGILTRGLTPSVHDPLLRPLISAQLAQQGRRFTIEFTSDQAINFTDRRGARVRFRYQPVYGGGPSAAGAAVAVLDAGLVRMPDMAVEIFPARTSPAGAPELILVLDAKYSSAPQRVKVQEIATKYSRLGDVKTGRIFSRQVWALTPAAPEGVSDPGGLRRYCTVDNEAFWSAEFDMSNPVNGAVQARPVSPGSFDPLRTLIVSLLRRAGVDYAEPPDPP